MRLILSGLVLSALSSGHRAPHGSYRGGRHHGAVHRQLADNCSYALEIIQLQDASDSFKDDLVNMQSVAEDLFTTLKSKYPGMKYGIASFVDKPLPSHGYGNYGGYVEAGIQFDYCYSSDLQMTGDAQKYKDAMARMRVGSGFDFQENQIEGMLRCALDPSTGFSPPDVKYDSSGRPIVRVMVMVTDATPHDVGDAAASTTNWWNYPVTYSADGSSTGGFGSNTYGNELVIYDKEKYGKIVEYLKKMNHDKQALTAEEKADYDATLKIVGPYPWPAIVPHTGDTSLPCEQTEYPSADQMALALSMRQIYPVVLLASPGDKDALIQQCAKKNIDYADPNKCMEQIYTNMFSSIGLSAHIGQLEAGSKNIVDAIISAIGTITEEVCVGSTMPPAPPVGPTPSPVGPTQPVPVPVPSGGGGGSSSGGSNTAVVVGAAAGGAAVLAAAAYGGWALLGGSPPPADVPSATQIEVPEAPVEREAVEEVTMEMFQ